jgi:iron complex transport system substrate-binding protein
MRRLISVMIGLTAFISGQVFAQKISPQRIVSLGGGVTEIIFALGQQHRLAGVDQSSLYPEQAQLLPSVGYYRSIPIEGILQLKPDMVIASEQAGPEYSLSQLSLLGLRVERVSDQPQVDSLYRRIEQVAGLLGVPERGKLIREALEHDLAHSYQHSSDRTSVMLVVMRSGKLLGAGNGTAAAKIISLSSLDNVLNDVQGYQQISAEIVSKKMPSALIVTTSSVQSLGGILAVRDHPALRHIPAVKNGRLIELEDLLAQGLGLRLPYAIQMIRAGVRQ